MYKEHPAFNAPQSDAVLWRYMDFTKFVSLLEKQALFFARADKLGDPFEGSVSKLNEILGPIIYKDKISALRALARWTKESRRFTLINCWHENPHESEAMWRLYTGEKDGIAIKTDFNSFKMSFTCSEDIYIGKVSYIDYNSHFIPESNAFFPYLHKRKSFEHEREIRAIEMTIPTNNQGIDTSQDICAIGKYYNVDLSTLIQTVIVAPFAPEWFLELVKSVTTRYNFNFPVVKSTQADKPTWG